MTTEQGTEVQGTEATEAQPIIPGTTWKTPEEAAKGFSELKSLVDRQGNELGMTRKQLEQAANLLEKATKMTAKPEQAAAAQGPDYDTELAKIDAQIEKLDVDDPGYGKTLAQLNRQARTLEAQRVKTETEGKLMSQFEKVLSERDSQQQTSKWRQENPDFDTPEMQQAINQKIATDKTGMMDPVLAYREIQLDQLKATLQQMGAENEDFKSRLKLKSGEADVGKVVTKTGGGVGTQSKSQGKVTGAALDEGMRQAFRAAG
jgi:hypothetical protein